MVRRGKLAPAGVAVHAATFLRQGRIVLDRELVRSPRELRRIFIHELCHFVWWKLGNPRRMRWEVLLEGEFRRRARGELGWSSELRKQELRPIDISARSRAWREYCCESFCDTGASHLSGVRTHDEFTLAPQFRKAREQWLTREDIIQSEEELVQFVDPQKGRLGFVWADDMPCLLPLAPGQGAVGKGVQRPQGSAGLSVEGRERQSRSPLGL
jgi:predicted SprT family Zn-dependent metalloprotease